MQEDQLYVIGFTPVWGRNTFIHTYMFTETIYYTEVQTLWRAKCGGTPYFFFHSYSKTLIPAELIMKFCKINLQYFSRLQEPAQGRGVRRQVRHHRAAVHLTGPSAEEARRLPSV